MSAELTLRRSLHSLHTDLTTDIKAIKVDTRILVSWIECTKKDPTAEFITQLIKTYEFFEKRGSSHSAKQTAHQTNYTLLSSQTAEQKRPIITTIEDLLKNFNMGCTIYKHHLTKFDIELKKLQNPVSEPVLPAEQKNPDQKQTDLPKQSSEQNQQALASITNPQINANSLSTESSQNQ